MPAQLYDPFAIQFYNLLQGQLDDRMVALAKGSAIQYVGENLTVAEKYAAATAYMQCLSDIMQMLVDTERERHGGSTPEPE